VVGIVLILLYFVTIVFVTIATAYGGGA